MVKQAYRQRLILNNPATEVKTIQGTAKKKDTLTLEEIQVLANTETQSGEVKRAFLFCLVTGLRWIDVKSLSWKSINLKARVLVKRQSKSDKDTVVNLNDTAIDLLAAAPDGNALVFKLPSANGANKSVKAWMKRAGIDKYITWHNARHSFGTNLGFLGEDITTASSLLGHSRLKHTQRYVKAAHDLKQRATPN